MKKIKLAYGNDELSIELPLSQIIGHLTPNTPPQRKEAKGLVEAELCSQKTFRIFESLFASASQFCIIVPDKTRNCGAEIVLPLLVNRLNDFGIKDSQIKILLALGSHSSHRPEELERVVGQEALKRLQVVEHDARSDDLVHLGETSFGTPVLVNSHLIETDRIIVVGAAVHHYFAGYGGGPKMINPGCAGYETIRRNHALSVDHDTGGLHPNCRPGVVEGNPIQEDILDSLRLISADVLFESVLDERGSISEFFSGELLPTHTEACESVDRLYKIPIPQRAELVLASCGGYPKDINFIQAHKTLNNAYQAVKVGGVIVCVAECRDGIGSQTFMNWFQYIDEEQLLEHLIQNYTLNGTTALSLRVKAQKCNIVFVSSLPDDLVTNLGLIPAKNLADGWRKAQALLPDAFRCIVMPHGSLTLPFCDDQFD